MGEGIFQMVQLLRLEEKKGGFNLGKVVPNKREGEGRTSQTTLREMGGSRMKGARILKKY